MSKRGLKSDAIIAIVFSFVGGLLDVYCLFNFNVYATLHTGNLIKLMTHLVDGNLAAFLDTTFVIVAFAVGIFLTNMYENSRKKREERELFVISFVLLLLAALAPNDRAPGELSAWKRIAAFLLGLEGAFLIRSFIRFGEYSYSATTMTANINRLVTVIHKRVRENDRSQNYAILVYTMIFLSFLLGVACGYGYLHAVPVKESGWWHWYGYNLILLAPMACMIWLWFATPLRKRHRE
ncbi:MAG: DUF1275 domain-containing protein [Clostridia bacterium]|nr:DUF1275 domain-containing protein [Clostridia bacterium]MBQ9212241.1 DUF1275 domain-containing protein [Clostridia bacterium]